jgi:myo-inositol-1(or 4)-monophosphatase
MNDIIITAGNILKQGFFEFQNFREKERGHLLSEYDLIVNDYLISAIQKKYPDDSIYSEECEEVAGSSVHRWIIDPIDGTAYFIFGEPYFSISAAREKDGEIIESHVLNPVTGDYYYSDAIDKKSFLNGTQIKVSEISDVKNSLVSFGFSVNMKAIREYYEDWKYLFDNCKKGIPWICPALSICNVARGRIEVFIDKGCSFEGQAAASLILKNAGGMMTNYDGTVYDVTSKGGVFTNGVLNIQANTN